MLLLVNRCQHEPPIARDVLEHCWFVHGIERIANLFETHKQHQLGKIIHCCPFRVVVFRGISQMHRIAFLLTGICIFGSFAIGWLVLRTHWELDGVVYSRIVHKEPVVSTSARPAIQRCVKDLLPLLTSKQTLDLLIGTIENNAACLQSLRQALKRPLGNHFKAYFFDMGSRSLDATSAFLNRYSFRLQTGAVVTARSFDIHCFEADPRFNSLYPRFIKLHSHKFASLTYHNLAVSDTNATVFLSDRSVGSSIVENSNGRAVQSFDFASFLGGILGNEDAFVVIKMDIESAEFNVLLRMLRTTALLLVDELLLECHINTKKERHQRNVSHDIGLDDCQRLISVLNKVLHSSTVPFEAVLWNSVRTALPSGYIQRHGGFKPT